MVLIGVRPQSPVRQALAYHLEFIFISIPRHARVVYDNRLMATTGAHVGNHYVLQNERALRFYEQAAGFKREMPSLKTVAFGSVKLEEIRLKRPVD